MPKPSPHQCLASEPKEDVIHVLQRAKRAILEGDYVTLQLESNHIIHCATVHQNQEAIQTAVIVYALGKILERGQTISMEIAEYIGKAIEFLEFDNIRGFNNEIKSLLKAIGQIDDNLSKYMQHVITEARIKKGSRIYEHGISLRQTAEIFNLSQWELMKYIGKTKMSEYAATTVPIKNVLNTQGGCLTKMPRKKVIVFDSGPIINFAINSLLWVLRELKRNANVEFYITPAVYDEIINKPLQTRKYKLEALQVLPFVTDGTINVYKHPDVKRLTSELEYYANNTFQIRKKWVKIVHRGEIEALATAIHLNADAIGIDERTTRHLIERPEKIAEHMEHKIHTEVIIDWKNLNHVKKKVKNVHVIRSAELVTIAYEKGIFNNYIEGMNGRFSNAKTMLLEGALWAVKLNGCSLKEQEIKQIVKMQR